MGRFAVVVRLGGGHNRPSELGCGNGMGFVGGAKSLTSGLREGITVSLELSFGIAELEGP